MCFQSRGYFDKALVFLYRYLKIGTCSEQKDGPSNLHHLFCSYRTIANFFLERVTENPTFCKSYEKPNLHLSIARKAKHGKILETINCINSDGAQVSATFVVVTEEQDVGQHLNKKGIMNCRYKFTRIDSGKIMSPPH